MAYLNSSSPSPRNAPRPRARLGDLGIQIGPRIRVGGTVGKIGQNAKVATIKAVKDTGHEAGRVASNKYVQGATALTLAATGVGAPAAAAILAAQRGGGALLKPGGTIGKGARGAAEGAAAGIVVGNAGRIVRGGISLAKGGGSLINRAAKGVVGRVKDTWAPDGDVATETSDQGRGSNRVTNGKASAIARGRGKNGKTGGLTSIIEQLRAQFTPPTSSDSGSGSAPQATTPVDYASMAPSSSSFITSPVGIALLLGGGLLLLNRPAPRSGR